MQGIIYSEMHFYNEIFNLFFVTKCLFPIFVLSEENFKGEATIKQDCIFQFGNCFKK